MRPRLDDIYAEYVADRCTMDDLMLAIHRVAMLMLRGDEDTAQQACLEVFKSLPSYMHRGTFGAWIIQIIKHTRSAAIRDSVKHTADMYLETVDYDGDRPSATTYALDEITKGDEQLGKLIHLLLAGFSIKDAALQMGLKPDTAAKRLQRARKKLQACPA